MPYSILEAPIHEGGLSCPSLLSWKCAYDLKFLSDLISEPCHILWKVWAMNNLTIASTSTNCPDAPNLNPLLQWALTKPTKLEPRLWAAFLTAQYVSLDPRSQVPSLPARLSMPALYHPAMNVAKSKKSSCLLSHGVSIISDLEQFKPYSRSCRSCRRKSKVIMDGLTGTTWDPSLFIGPHPGSTNLNLCPQDPHALDYIRILAGPTSLLTTPYQALASKRGTAHIFRLPYLCSALPPPPPPPRPP